MTFIMMVKSEVELSGNLLCQPIFEPELMWQARFRAEDSLLRHELSPLKYPALEVAATLVWYNWLTRRAPSLPTQRVENYLNSLITKETNAACPKDPRPTIGIEVESPRKPYRDDKVANFHRYSELFAICGMPENRDNKLSFKFGIGNYPDSWEFSPPPAYSVMTISRILSELIHGHFIPSLRTSKDPRDIKWFLDDKLVSLHANLAIPNWVDSGQAFYDYFFKGEQFSGCEELDVFSSALALGFTSPLRLANRRSDVLCIPCDNRLNSTAKYPASFRYEIKALEVRDATVYQVLDIAQYLGAALFTHLGGKTSYLGKLWSDLHGDICALYQQKNIHLPSDYMTQQINCAARDRLFTTEIRNLLLRGRRQAIKLTTYSDEITS